MHLTTTEPTLADPAHGAVVLVLPSDGRFASVARGAAVSCASLESFDVDEMVDVRLLVDEVFHAIARLGDGCVTLTMVPTGGTVELVVSAPSSGASAWSDPELDSTRRIIGAICRAAAFGLADGRVWFEGELYRLGG